MHTAKPAAAVEGAPGRPLHRARACSAPRAGERKMLAEGGTEVAGSSHPSEHHRLPRGRQNKLLQLHLLVARSEGRNRGAFTIETIL